jgi:hypothetical protein
MYTAVETPSRELDHRHSDGIDVRLLWNPVTDHVSVMVEDHRSGESLAFDVDAAHARAAFDHPYSYARRAAATVKPTVYA